MKNQYKTKLPHRWVLGINPRYNPKDKTNKQYWIAVKSKDSKQYQLLCEFDNEAAAQQYWDTIVV